MPALPKVGKNGSMARAEPAAKLATSASAATLNKRNMIRTPDTQRTVGPHRLNYQTALGLTLDMGQQRSGDVKSEEIRPKEVEARA
jgi:hypothetical protein